MTYDNFTESCSPGSWCGSCPTPCFLDGEGDTAFDTLADRGPDPEPEYPDLAEAVGDTDTFALGCGRWDDSAAPCNSCAGNYFCFYSFQASA
ncbi:hypothetical protein [Nonomuraea sp. NPDC049129]|uniref:hypothetical protein n=1 Tax=Nonomuraea sp. NPDC049129 TaxID=3155272 RepID=UPI0033CA4CB0